MGILDWFKNRPAQFDTGQLSDEMTLRAIDKAVTLTNPRLKLLRSYQERLAPAVRCSVDYLRATVLSLPPPLRVAGGNWAFDARLRAFFAAPTDIPLILSRSTNLRTLFDKYPQINEAFFVLGMAYNEQRTLGMSIQGEIVQREVAQTVVSFSGHQARICGQTDAEVLRLLGAQGFEYLVAQALAQIGEERAERRELEENRALIRSRLRLLQQQGPGLGTVFGAAPVAGEEQLRLEAELLDNERQLEEIGSAQDTLDNELDCLSEVLSHPQDYLRIERRQLCLSAMNVVLDETSSDVSAEVDFSLAHLTGVPAMQRAFVVGCFAREEMQPPGRIDFSDAERYL